MTGHRDERGTALLLAILATAILGAGLMAVLSLSGTERRAVLDQQAQTEAYAVAQTGLEQFAANRATLGFNSSPAAAYESTRVQVSGGYADVVLQRLRPAVGTSPAMYVLRSTGYATGPQLSGVPLAERQVAQLATWSFGGMTVQGALTGINGVTKSGSSGGLAGQDACGASAAVAGLATTTSPAYNGKSGTATGSPAIVTLGSSSAAAATVSMDWDGIVNHGAANPSITIPSAKWPSFSDPSYWPTILVNGDYALPGSGQGTLIVTGSLTISAKTWKGVILVGDEMKISGAASVAGAVVTGLNVKLGGSVPVTTMSGSATIQFNSCNVASALARYGGLSLIKNAWVDNWAGW